MRKSWPDKSVSGSRSVADAVTKSSRMISETLVAHVHVVFTEGNAVKSNALVLTNSYEDCERRMLESSNPDGKIGVPTFRSLYQSTNQPVSAVSRSSSDGISISDRSVSNVIKEGTRLTCPLCAGQATLIRDNDNVMRVAPHDIGNQVENGPCPDRWAKVEVVD